MIKVWHLIDRPRDDLPLPPPASNPLQGCRLVAEVDSDDLEEAFRLTNTIDKLWWEHPAVLKIVPDAARSTSVGDILEEEDGTLWQLLPIGLRLLEREAG